jgi:HEAT repeat protein
MRLKLVALGVVAALAGVGIWIARSTSATPDKVSVREPTAERGQPPSPSASTSAARPAAAAPSLARPAIAADLARDLRDPDPKIRSAAVREVANGADPDPTILLAASRDPDLSVGVVATEALGKLHAKGEVSVEDMIARATDHRLNERVRASAINGLGLVPSPQAAETLTRMLSGDLLERRSAAILLAHQDPELAVPALIGALADADEVVRTNALEALRTRSRGRDFGSDAAAWRAWWQSRPR